MAESLPNVTINVAGVFKLQVCATKGQTRGVIAWKAEELMPHGRDLGWFLREEATPVQCADHDDREHWVLV